MFKKIDPGIWTYEKVGDEIVGILKKVEDSKKFDNKVYSFEINGEQMVVFGTTVLDNRMAFVNEGDKVKIVYKGMEKNQKGQPTKMFDVYKDEPETSE